MKNECFINDFYRSTNYKVVATYTFVKCPPVFKANKNKIIHKKLNQLCQSEVLHNMVKSIHKKKSN